MLAALLLAVTVAWGTLGHAAADGVVVRTVSLTPGRVLAEGGQATVRVTVGGADAVGSHVTLSTTLGAFGAANGPSRIVLTVDAADNGDGLATTTIVGDGRPGDAVLTARIDESVKTAVLTFVGPPAAITFTTATGADVLDAASEPRVTVGVADAEGVGVPGLSLSLSVSAGLLRPISGEVSPTRSVTLITDTGGRATVRLTAEPGVITLTARAAAVTARKDLTLHGPPDSLRLLASRGSINLGDTPFPAPDGSLVALLLDEGGRPVPGARVSFSTDVGGAIVLFSGAGESALTDPAGRAVAHLSALEAIRPGLVTVSAAVGDLKTSALLRVVGPPAVISLELSPTSFGVFAMVARITDASGLHLPTGWLVDYTATGVPAGSAQFDPAAAEVREGIAQTVLRLGAPGSGVTVRATVRGTAPALSASALIPAATAGGTALVAGLNSVVWTGAAMPVSQALAPIASVVSVAWRLDAVTGWVAYIPGFSLGADFFLNPGDLFFIVVRVPTVLSIP